MNSYYQQTKLMLQLLPVVAEESCFALKGGTAINFFIRDLPRYSIDIDLTYIKFDARNLALEQLALATERIAQNIEKRFPYLKVTRQYTKQTKRLVKLLVNQQNIQVKIEPNELIRGSVYPAQEQTLVKKAENEFDTFVSMRVLSIADLYGGKICAALDRQHPRDLFDIKLLLENEGITKEIRKAFVAYLASHSRPMSELLSPAFIDIRTSYQSNFEGITNLNVSCNELIAIRKQLVTLINKILTDNERNFLLSLKQGEPNWQLMEIENLNQFPAIQWKLLNIRKMDKNKHRLALEKLKTVLEF
ncbi:MAG: nucleotidyl transferase AbiEii/AbiGii toxin family protein [Pseudomonadota bacterium]